jgi:low affinity Fe/Cu permease
VAGKSKRHPAGRKRDTDAWTRRMDFSSRPAEIVSMPSGSDRPTNASPETGVLHSDPGPILERLGTAATKWTGRNSAFLYALLLVVGWALVGPLFHYSDTWQLFINTVTNLVTFLMVFLIQRSQNKDTLALQLKLNELIAAQRGAHNSLINIENLSEAELASLRDRFSRLAEAFQGSNATSIAVVTVDQVELD